MFMMQRFLGFGPCAGVVLAAGLALMPGTAERAAIATDTADTAASRYRACLNRAVADPAAALAEAAAWQASGGGAAARHCLAAARLQLGQPVEAARDFEALAAASPAGSSRKRTLLSQAGDAWLAADDAERAVASFNQALALLGTDTAALIGRARARAAQRQLAVAIDDLSAAIAADPLLTEAFVLRASALRQLGHFDRAAADLETALTLTPNAPEALLERGLLRQAAGDPLGARSDWQHLVAQAPGSAAAEVARRHLDDAGDRP